LAAYYPRKMATFQDLQKLYPEYEMVNEPEEDRLEAIKMYVLLIEELDEANNQIV
jgi:small subunit ribosomal protein S33